MTLRTALIIALAHSVVLFGIADVRPADATTADGRAPLRKSVPKARVPALRTAVPSGRIIVKFKESSGVRAIDGGVRSVDKAAAGRVTSLLLGAAPGAAPRRLFRRDARALDELRSEAEARSGRRLPDLNTYLTLDPGLGDRAGDALSLIVEKLLADPAVETAYLEPRYVPAGSPPIGDDAGTRPRHVAVADESPDYSADQGYLDAPPEGLNALAVAGLAGGRGEDVKVVDVEVSWLWTHEDLTTPFAHIGTAYPDPIWRNHGTAVAGVIRGGDDGSGIRGLAPESRICGASIYDLSPAEAIIEAAETISSGDVILIEIQGPGPNAMDTGEFGYLPIEYWQDNFDAILLASASGRIVVELAGNGQQDLDSVDYFELFDPDYRDSQAIMVGAAKPDLTPEFYTNYGQRVDVNAWGREVVTCGYGDLQGTDEGLPEERWYTDGFAGTSSASAIVAGAVADLQGMARAQMGFPLDAGVVREALTATGTPQQTSVKHVGPRPDILAAWTLVQGSIGHLSGRVSNSETQLGLSGVQVDVSGVERTVVTDRNGYYDLNLPAGSVDIEIDEYAYAVETVEAGIVPGQSVVRDITLDPLPLMILSGRIAGRDTLYLGNMRVWAPELDIPRIYSRHDGAYDLPWLAVGREVAVLFDGRPWHGAHVLKVTPQETVSGLFFYVNIRIPPIVESFSTSAGYAVFGAGWDWGPPTNGPGESFSFERCWGVGLDYNYEDETSSELYSVPYEFEDTETLFLSFHYWCSTEPSYDGANLWYAQGTDWILLEPLSGYTHRNVAALDAQPGWSGEIEEWRGAVFDLSDLDHDSVRFRIRFRSDRAIRGEGFFIDDIAFRTDDHDVGVEMTPDPAATARPELASSPNPFNPSTRLAWRNANPGPVEIEIFDARGRRVDLLDGRSDETGAGFVTWRGRTGDGRALPSGVYLVRLRDAAGEMVRERVTLLR